MSLNENLPPLPLLHESDGYVLRLEKVSEKTLVLVEITKFPGNSNVIGESWTFRDLTPMAKKAVIEQILRRYPGYSVKV